MTQEGLAAKLGISRSALSHYEKNRREPDYATLSMLADLFNVSTDYLLGRTDEPDSETDSGGEEERAVSSEDRLQLDL